MAAAQVRTLLRSMPACVHGRSGWLPPPFRCRYSTTAPSANRQISHDRQMIGCRARARIADDVVAMKNGRIEAHGLAETVLTDPILRHLYDIEARVSRTVEGVTIRFHA